MLIILCGLPGVGKSSLAKEISQRIGAAYIRIDSIENGVQRSVLRIKSLEDAGYQAAYAVAQDNLLLGLTVVADSVNPIEVTQRAWRNVAERAGVPAIEVEVVCTDPVEHQRRIETRRRKAKDQGLPNWRDVLSRDYTSPQTPDIMIDTAGKTIEDGAAEFFVKLKTVH